MIRITSPHFFNNQYIPQKYTCEAENVSPPLKIGDVPPRAQSLVLLVEDVDSIRGVWSHWVLWNIPPGTEVIETGKRPLDAEEGINDFGKLGYGGPCPEHGIHQYEFTIYALDTMLSLPTSVSTREDVKAAMAGHILESNHTVGLYEKKSV